MNEREKSAKAAYWDEWRSSHIDDEAILAACKKYAAWGRPEKVHEAARIVVTLWNSGHCDHADIKALAAALDAPASAEPEQPEGAPVRNPFDTMEWGVAEPSAQPEAPTEDVVERMIAAYESAPGVLQHAAMTAALAVAREGCYTLAEIEKAIHAVYISWGWKVSIEYFADSVLRRLTAKPEPTLQDRVAIILDNRWQFVDAHQRKETAEMIVAELEKEEAK